MSFLRPVIVRAALAAEGADVITVVDASAMDIDTVPYALARVEDLAEIRADSLSSSTLPLVSRRSS